MHKERGGKHETVKIDKNERKRERELPVVSIYSVIVLIKARERESASEQS